MVSTEATQEAALQQLLDKVHDKWRYVEFTINPYKDAKDTYILGAVDEVMAVLEDSMVMMGNITASRFVAGIRCVGGRCRQGNGGWSRGQDGSWGGESVERHLQPTR